MHSLELPLIRKQCHIVDDIVCCKERVMQLKYLTSYCCKSDNGMKKVSVRFLSDLERVEYGVSQRYSVMSLSFY